MAHSNWREAYEKSASNIHWVTYEELSTDPILCITNIVKLLNLNCTNEDVRDIAKASSFSKMKQNFEENDAEKARRGEYVKPNHMRKGRVGGFKNTLTNDLQILLTEVHCRKCEEYNLDLELFSVNANLS